MLTLKELVQEVNIAKRLDAEQLAQIGKDCVEGYAQDLASRSEWEQRNAEAIKLALQVSEEKSFPWVNCSNVKFPLITIAALQFLSRVAILTKGRHLVQCDVLGADPHGMVRARADRISGHMSYQIVEEDTEWITQDEQTKLSASILGASFKKSYYDLVQGINISEHVPASKLVVDYYTKEFKSARRITHFLEMSENDIQERVNRGLFCEMETDQTSIPSTNLLQVTSDQAQGITPSNVSSSLKTFAVLEQHTWLDLDGDNYKEPYIVFARHDTGQVLRIVARFFDDGDVFRVNDAEVRRLRKLSSTFNSAGKAKYTDSIKKLEESKDNHIVRIEPQQFFTKYTFIPSPDGGFYGLGFGPLLGPLNGSVNTLINQLIDGGTMSNTAGGFLGRGAKIKGGKLSFDPFEWKTVESTGDDLRKNIFPLPVREPSQVLYTLLGLLVNYSERISGATDIMTGQNPGQNTPAETSRNTIEQGMKIFSGIYGRMYRSFKSELQLLYNLNCLYIKSSRHFDALTSGDGALFLPEDYDKASLRVFPSADPSTASEEQRRQKASLVKAAAAQSPLYNRYLVEKQFLEAHDVPNIPLLLPDPTGENALPPPRNMKLEIEMGKLELAKNQQQIDSQLAILDLQREVQLDNAKIEKLLAEAERARAEADGVDVGHRIALINAQVGAARERQSGVLAALEILRKRADSKHDQQLDIANFQREGAASGTDKSGTKGMGAASGNAGATPAA